MQSLNEELSGAVVAQLLARCFDGRLRDIRVIECERGLILQGYAQSYYVKQLVQETARRISTVPVAANEIIVA